MEDKLIWCDAKEKLTKVVTKLKKDGYSTADVDWMWNSYGNDVALRVKEERKDTTFASKTWYKENGYGDAITAEEFLGKKKNPNIVIFRRGREVIAKDVATGNEGIAKCSPNDEFNFHTGASIALARLMSKVPATGVLNPDVRAEWTKLLGITEIPKKVYTDSDRNFKVGDRVVVRDWDDMAKEYGVYDGGGTIKCPNGFTVTMKHLCGRTATVTSVNGTSIGVDFDDKSGDVYWGYAKQMFNPIDSGKPTPKFNVGDLVTLKSDAKSGEMYDGAVLLDSMIEKLNGKSSAVTKVEIGNDLIAYTIGNGYIYSESMLEKCDESKIYEGDTVKVINTGLNYSSYVKWVGEHISDPYMAARFCFSSPSTDKNYKVIKIAEHERNHRPLAYIEEIDGLSYNRCYLIEVKGLEKV